MSTIVRTIAISLCIATLLAGCATVPRDAGLAELQRDVASRASSHDALPLAGADDAAIRDLLARGPIDADGAAAIALFGSPRVQIALADLGIARADLIDASTIGNPLIGAELRFPADPVHPFELRIAESLADLARLRHRRALGEAEFAAARLRATAEILRSAADARSAYYDLLAATQRSDAIRTMTEAARAATELAERQHDAGNINDLDVEKEQAQRDEAELELARADEELLASRERFVRALGLRDRTTAWTIATTFPPIGEVAPSDAEIDRATESRRLDLAVARAEVEIARRAVPIARLAVLGDAEIDVHLERDASGARTAGPGIELPIPLFGRGVAARTRAEARYLRSRESLAEATIAAEAELRIAKGRLAAARARVVEYRDVVLPRHSRLTEQTRLHYESMAASLFDLLRARESEAHAARQYADAQRDYWLARNDLDRAINGTADSQMTVTQTGGSR